MRPQALCADVACLAWDWRMRGQAVFAPAGAIGGPLLSETFSAKEAKETDRLRWKSPRLFLETEKGLQCGLSGSRVARMATPRRGVKGETASIGNERYAAGKTNPYLSRKIYFFCRRCLSLFYLCRYAAKTSCAASAGFAAAHITHVVSWRDLFG